VSVKERTAALSLLGHESAHRDQDLDLLTSLLTPRVASQLQSAAVEALARRRGADLPAVLLAEWKQHTPGLRSEILSTLLSREAWTESLIEALELGFLPPQDLDAAARQRLLSSRRRTIRDAAAKLFGTIEQNDRAEILSSYSDVLSLTGDITNGAAIFKKVCSSCHQHGGMGKDLAPRLATVQNKSTDTFLTAILDPNQAVEQKYQGYVIVTNDGRVLSGLVKTESGGSLVLAEPNGREHEILRIDIDQMQSTGKSFMPEGLEKDLSPQAVADVIAFIRESK
jgi:putative heme-binding domain-containing protein